MERVSVLVQVHCSGVSVQLQGPPSREDPSSHWWEKLAAVLRPLGQETNTFRCVLFGSLPEVACHLWQHQILWMHLKPEPGQGSTERHVAVSLSEVVEPSADFSSGRYHNTVPLEEESLDGSGQVSIGITLEVIREDLNLQAASVKPSLEDVFLLHLQLAKGGTALVAQAARKGPPGSGLYLRCCGVEQPLQESMDHTLVLVSTWAEVPQALLDLDVCLQAPTEHDVVDLPLDLSELVAAASDRGGAEGVAAQARSEALPGQSTGISFTVSVRSLHWSSQLSRLQSGRTKDSELLWTEGLATAPRTWRISVEIRSLRLTTCTANAFIVYAYELLQQPRPFRTNPPVLARKNNTVYLPQGFRAYTLTATNEELAARLEDPLRVEVWHRDTYAKDTLMGLTEFGLGAVFDRPIQYSASMPSMVCGFRALDQVCPVMSTADQSQGNLGLLRMVLFVEDLGPATGAAATAFQPAQAPPAPEVVPPGAGISAPANALPTGRTPLVDLSAPIAETSAEPNAETAAALEGLQALRSSPEYSKAFQLELWKRAEEEKFRTYLKEEEAAMREGLEEDYRQRELQRAKDFRQRQTELKDLEAKVRKKFQELQQREVAIVSEEARVATMAEEAKRRADRAIQEIEDASRRKAAEAEHGLRLERDRGRHLEGKLAELEAEVAAARQRCKDMEAEVDARRKKLEELPQVKLQQELQELQLQLRDSERRSEALAASRDHFRGKVEELCRRLLRSQPHESIPAVGSSAVVREGNEVAVGVQQSLSVDAMHQSAEAGMVEMKQALQNMQEHLSDLAREWSNLPPGGAHAAASVAPAVAVTPQQFSVQHFGGGHAMEVAAQNNPTAMVASVADGGVHLQWLRGQKEELLQSGMYSDGDPVLLALDARIAEALAADGR